MSDDDDKDTFDKGCALIQANLHVNPTEGTYEKWAQHYAYALWIEKWRLKNQTEAIARLLGGEVNETRPTKGNILHRHG